MKFLKSDNFLTENSRIGITKKGKIRQRTFAQK